MRAYTAAEVDTIEAASVEVDFTVELVDEAGDTLEDITGDVLTVEVEHDSFRTIHGRCKLRLERELLWGSVRVRPTAKVSADGVTVTAPLGVFLLSSPQVRAGETPQVFDVVGYDKLEVLAHPHGDTFRVDAGDAYLDVVETLIVGAGETSVALDPAAASVTAVAGRVWPIDQRTTTLDIVNDLLAAVAYRPLWVDGDGTFRSEPDVDLATRAPEWSYDAASETTTVASSRTLNLDLFSVPNRWVFIRDDPAQDFPEEGAGVYTVANQSDGPTSIDDRGRTITKVVKVRDVASQDELETFGDRMAESDRRLSRQVSMLTSPNPLHGHRDVVALSDPELGVVANFVVESWWLPLDGSDMALTLREVS